MKHPDTSDISALQNLPHRRFNPLTREWVLVSPHRADRPWQGQTEPQEKPSVLAYDPDCYLCPRNSRVGGARNPDYSGAFVFENDFAALRPELPAVQVNAGNSDVLKAETETGICRVVCFSPRHDLTLSRMSLPDVRSLVDVWIEQFQSLRRAPAINYVQIFENRGQMMGCSNPHPHGQIWGTATIPNEPAKEQAALGLYQKEHGACLLCEYVRLEDSSRERVVCSNDGFLAVVPFWAMWPFEILLIARPHVGDLTQLDVQARTALAGILKCVTGRYDNLFSVPFPYSMGFHQQPADAVTHPEWHLHAHFYPPLLRSATVRKFMVGFELLGSPQRDITPEYAAATLRSLPAESDL